MMKKRATWISLAVMGLLITAGAVWAWKFREDPNVTKAREISNKLFDPDSKLSSEDRGKLWQQARDATENLTEEQRREVRREGFQKMRQKMEERIDEYFALEDDDERNAFLDEEIQKWEDRRKEWEQRRKDDNAKPGEEGRRGGEAGRGGRGPGGRGGPGGGRGPGGRGAGGDKEGRKDRMRNMLDSTSPTQRAKFMEYMTAIKERREELGLPAWGRK